MLDGVSDKEGSSSITFQRQEQASQIAQWYRICLPMQETWIRSLGWEDPLEEGMVTYSSILV